MAEDGCHSRWVRVPSDKVPDRQFTQGIDFWLTAIYFRSNVAARQELPASRTQRSVPLTIRRNLATVQTEVVGKVGYLILNRPERLNAIDNQLVLDAETALNDFAADDGVRVIVVKGAGRAFCSGYDLKISAEERKQNFGSEYGSWEWIRWQLEKWERLWRMSKPTIAQVHGYCYAGGVSVMGNCDLIVAADNSLIGQPESRAQGYAPDMGLWHYTIGPRRTKELLFTGRAVSGAEALEIGMVNYAVPADGLEEFTGELAATIAHQSADMLAYSKAMVNQQFDIQGLHTSMMAGINFDALSKRSEAYAAFRANMAQNGLKQALADRDAPFGGTQRIAPAPKALP